MAKSQRPNKVRLKWNPQSNTDSSQGRPSLRRTAFPIDKLAQFVGYRFQTLDQGHTFYLRELQAVGVYYVRITGSTGWLPIKAFQSAWHSLQSGAEVSLIDLETHLRRATPYRTDHDSSCFASMLASVEPVRYLKGPIRLFLADRVSDSGMTYGPEKP